MKKSFALAALICAAVIATENQAQAVFVTSNGDIAIAAPQTVGSPPIVDIKLFGGVGGRSYTNQVSGAGFAAGGEVRTASAYVATTATNGSQVPISFTNGDLLGVVAVIRGTIQTSAPSASALFDLGRAFLIRFSPATENLDPLDPSSWDDGEVFAEFALKPQEPVIPNPAGEDFGSQIAFSADQTNVSAVNTLGTSLTQGQFLFREDSTNAQNATGLGDNFISNVDDFTPPGLIKSDEALLTEIDQTLETIAGSTIDDTDLGVINAFFASLGVGTWADTQGTGGAGSDYDPFIGGPNGDFRATFGVDNHIGHQFVPEPSSILSFGVLLGLAGIRTRSRRRSARTS